MRIMIHGTVSECTRIDVNLFLTHNANDHKDWTMRARELTCTFFIRMCGVFENGWIAYDVCICTGNALKQIFIMCYVVHFIYAIAGSFVYSFSHLLYLVVYFYVLTERNSFFFFCYLHDTDFFLSFSYFFFLLFFRINVLLKNYR